MVIYDIFVYSSTVHLHPCGLAVWLVVDSGMCEDTFKE